MKQRCIVVLFFAAAWMATTSWAGLTGLWRFDGDDQDSVGSHHGTFVGAETYTNGYFNQAISLNGASYVNLGSGVLSTSAYTKAAWIFRTGGANNNVLSGDSSSNQHAFYLPSSGFLLSAGHNNVWTNVRDNVAIATGVWTHVAVTYDQSVNGGTLRLYRNGKLCGGTPVATNVAPPNGGACFIGAHGGASQFTGFIDEAAVWDHALSAKEVENLYRASQHAVSLPSATNWHDTVYDLVPEMTGFDVVYELQIPNTNNLGTTGIATYLWDNSAIYTNGLSFDRVAYYLELSTNVAATSQWVCVSLDPVTTDAKKLGVPSIATGAIFQQLVSNMNIYAGGSYVTTGMAIQTGNIEFWGYNYGSTNVTGVPNGRNNVYDCGDERSTSGSYGSMQIHNYSVNGTTNTQTLFAYNCWGTTGTNDLGIGNATSGTNPDWTFRYNAHTYTSKVMLVLARKLLLPVVNFTACPKPLQLYPRNLATGWVDVSINGAVTSTNCTQIAISVTAGGFPYTNIVQTLNYSGGQAPFSHTVPIEAGLVDYDFTIQVTSNGTPFTVVTANDVVAGDVFLINGQSNAEALLRSGSSSAQRSPWVRSFGYRSETVSTVQNDLNWYQAEGDLDGAGAVGQWGLRMGRVLMESNGVPVAIINGAKGGKAISYFLRTDSTPENLANNYGRLLYRVRQAGASNAVRAILWYQGESDNGDAPTHESGWLNLYRNWLRDYPTVEKVYVCQLHVGCSTPTWTVDLRNRQRIWADTYEKIEAMSTSGLRGHDTCHYSFDPGYRQLGEQISQLVLRDIYGFTIPSQAVPPNILCAYFDDASGSNVTVVTRNPDDQLTFGTGSGPDFRVEGLTNALVVTASASNNTIHLTFDRDVRSGSGLSFSGHSPTPAYVTNSLGLGLLYFHNQRILESLAVPTTPAGLLAAAVSSNRLDLSWNISSNASHYLVRRDGIVIGTAYTTRFLDTSITPASAHNYEIAAVSLAGTSTWTSAVSGQTAAHNVFALVPEANDYDILYQLDLAADFIVGTTLDMPYNINRSATITDGIQRVAYYLELQDEPGNPLRWVYASMTAFTNKSSLLGVPVSLKGATFQRYVQDLNVFASANSGITTGRHIATGNIEFWGNSYSASNAAAIPGASNSYYDFGDVIGSAGGHGSMQLHNYAAAQTVFAFNNYSASGFDAIGIGNYTSTNTDWTFAANTMTWNVKRLYVLVQTDANSNNLPDVWEMNQFGSLNAPNGGPDDDPDGDGQSNYKEWIAGTDPKDARSYLRVESPQGNGNDYNISFPTVAGKTYAIEYKNDLTDVQWDLLTTVAGTGGVLQVTDTDAALRAKRFYRIRIVP